jgi:hypothetical protein
MFQIAEQNGGQLSATLYYKYGFDGSGSHHRAMQPEDKVIVAERTAAVKSAFERELGLKVDRRRD